MHVDGVFRQAVHRERGSWLFDAYTRGAREQRTSWQSDGFLDAGSPDGAEALYL